MERTSLRPYLVVFTLSARVLNVREAKNVLLLVQNEERMHEMRSFDGPPSVYLDRLTVDTDVIQMDQAFPLHFCILQARGMVGRPGNEVTKEVLASMWQW